MSGEPIAGRPGVHLHGERHRYGRIGWLRAAVLGAGDGIVSIAALLIGVAASDASRSSILVAGFAGVAAGAMSMATGEYNSVSSQRDTERADIARERREQAGPHDIASGRRAALMRPPPSTRSPL